MEFIPHKYQAYAINFIEEHKEAAVLLDMGLGKTVITLTAINNLLFDSFDAHKVLVIGPLRVARDTWPEEIKKWDHLRNLKASLIIGPEDVRLKALNTKADIYIINRENVEWLVEKSEYKFDFDTVVIDELSSFKNGKSKRFKSLLKVRPRIKRIVGLTGTPAGNGLMDLWAQFRVLDMGTRLGRFITRYREAYFRPDKTNGQVVFSYKALPNAEAQIYKKISDITISMKSTDYLEMPELISNEYVVSLSEKERKVYKTFKDEFVMQMGSDEITAANAASLSMKLTQLANGAVYDDEGCIKEFHSHKLDALEDLIESANGKPVLVAYWFKHDLDRIKKRLTELKVNFAEIDKKESIDRWNKGELQVGLIHPASAGHGLNLQTGGSTLIWYGLTWSLELYQQTVGRLWRQGQKDKTVVVEHIITKGTVDELIIKALKNKDATQADLINAVKVEVKR